MKNYITPFLVMASILLSSICLAQVDVTYIPETNLTVETKPTLDGNFISLSYTNEFPLNFIITKLTSEGDIIWSNEITEPEEINSLYHIFTLNDGNYGVICDTYFIKLNASGEFISSVYYSAETLGYDPIAGDLGYANYKDIKPMGDGFLYLSTGYAAGENFFVLTKTDINGIPISSYAYLYEDYYPRSVIVEDEFAYVAANNYIINNYNLIKINHIDGIFVSETANDGMLTNVDLLNIGDGIILTGHDELLGLDYDIMTKYNYDGDTLWSNHISYLAYDSNIVIETITLESGNLLNLNSFWEYGEDGEYILRYFDSFGDTILNIHNFLDHHQFYINDLERKGDELIFSGLYYGLVDDVGFVLITDTLGEFNELVIQGTVYYDENDNGIVDPEEYTFHDRLITSDPPGNYAFTNSSGEYTMHIYEPGIYTLSTENPEYWDIMDPSEYSVEYDILGLEDILFNKDFRLDYTIPVLDLRVSTYQSVIRKGFSTNSCITVENVGNQAAVDAIAYLHHPSGFTYILGSPYTDYTDTIITWELNDFNPNEPITFCTFFTASADYIIDDIKLTVGSIKPVIGDYLIENNVDSIFTTVVAACDPNHKTVIPAGIGDEGYIDPNTEWLEYTVEFQNVGTAPATFVNIDDVIDTHLDLSSIEILGADHTYWMELSDENRITWHFDNINLPDSASDPAGSIGFVTYKIRVKEDAVVGTVITNTAYIYFDYNDAVITNTTKTTLELPNSITEFTKFLNAYPNPAGDYIILQLEEENTSGFNIKIYNINGEVVLNEDMDAGKQMIQINSSNYPNGIYFISCSDADGIVKTNAKFIVAH